MLPYFSTGFLLLQLIKFQKRFPILTFEKIKDFLVCQINAIVKITTPEDIVV